MEEELLRLSAMADVIYEFLHKNREKGLTNEEILHECPALYTATYFAAHDDENAKLLLKMVEERRKNDERNRKSGASGTDNK